MRAASMGAWARCRSDSATTLPSLPKTIWVVATPPSAGRWCPQFPGHHGTTGTAPAHGRGAGDGPPVLNSARPYFRNVSNIAQTPVPDVVYSSPHRAGYILEQSIFEPGEPRCANACGFFNGGVVFGRDYRSGTSAHLTDQYETDRPPKSALNSLQKTDVPDWLFSRDPARGNLVPSNLCGPPDCFTDTSRLLRRRPLWQATRFSLCYPSYLARPGDHP
jgi:hypothetical protein